MNRARSSRLRYQAFVRDYKERRALDADGSAPDPAAKEPGKRRQYLREYLRWLWPHRFAVGALFVLALAGAGLQMIEPLFMRYIVDRVLLNGKIDWAARLTRLNMAGTLFLTLIVPTNVLSAFRDYQQRIVNTRVMLSLRRSLFEQMLRLPLSKLWDMKTGGILSRLTGDNAATT